MRYVIGKSSGVAQGYKSVHRMTKHRNAFQVQFSTQLVEVIHNSVKREAGSIAHVRAVAARLYEDHFEMSA